MSRGNSMPDRPPVSKALAFAAWLTLTLSLSLPMAVRGGGPAAGEVPNFERDVLPILGAHCLKCHGAETRKNGLDLRSPALMLRGGGNGPVLVKGSAEESALFEQVASRSMPPGKAKLRDEQIEAIRAWIDGGAGADRPEAHVGESADPLIADGDRRYWAFLPLARPDVPKVQRPERSRTPIDAFVLAKLEGRGLGLSPEADRVALARRSCFDLLGLPPTLEQLDAFLADQGPDAYERWIDGLLESPHYGERWGRHWLDAAGYSDTVGTDNDAGIIRLREGLWRYRDYVVRAFNEDKPFDRFLREQLAGDEMVDWRGAAAFDPRIQDLLVATGFLRTAIDNTTENELNRPLERFEVLHGTIENVTSNLLGLTVACARCHDHKFDPIPQRDYYRLMALLTPAYNPQSWKQAHERHLPDVSSSEKKAIEDHNAELDRQGAALSASEAGLRQPVEAKLAEAKLATLPEPIRADTRAALDTPKPKRNPIQDYLAEKLGPQLVVKPDEVTRALGPEEGAKIAALTERRNALNARRRSFGKIQAIFDVGPPPETFLLKRGDHLTPGPAVEPGFLAVLDDSGGAIPEGSADPPAKSSGRRSALAHWLTRSGSPASALVARVMVNRAWQGHFGRGIVATSENFGRMGTPPTHPELLEWLAAEFVAGGWRLKPLHRTIMTSAVYRQASYRRASAADQARGIEPEAIDPEDALLWKMPLRRVEAEAVRDAILAVSGTLDRTMGGPPLPLEARPDGQVVVDEKALPTPTAKWRRSLYLTARRNYPLSMLGVFDVPLMTSNCARRVHSVVPLQALTMMNGSFARDQAEHFARRVERMAPAEALPRIELAFRLALGRRPTPQEAARAADLLRQQAERQAKADPKATPEEADQKALANLCLLLFNTNEFLYIE